MSVFANPKEFLVSLSLMYEDGWRLTSFNFIRREARLEKDGNIIEARKVRGNVEWVAVKLADDAPKPKINFTIMR